MHSCNLVAVTNSRLKNKKGGEFVRRESWKLKGCPLQNLRALVGKIKQYCLRFKSVLTRSWKYDAEVTEYFVQVSDTVRIKRSDLEKYEKTEDAEETDEFPSIQPKALMDTSLKALEDKKDGPGGKPASDLIALAESKENLNKFLDSLHRKASQATTWICSLEPPTLPNPNVRQKQYGS